MKRILARALACALLASCSKIGTTGSTGPGTSGGRHPWTKPGLLRMGVQNQPNTLDPLLSANTTEAAVARFIFDPLISVDGTGKQLIPVLASEVPTLENGGISRDGLTITYKLRKGVQWHDGTPFTSADVKFSWQAIMNASNNVQSHTGYDLVKAVDTPDDYTVVFHMKRVFAPAVNTMFAESDSPYYVVPKHLLASLPNINNIPFNSQPVGTGPFVFKEWARGDHITLVANDKYFLGKPKIRTIVIHFIPDENTEVNQLRTHDIDWEFEASPDLYAQLKNVPDLDVILQSRNQFERIHLNTTHPPLDDVRVRQAISYIVDRAKLTETLTQGSASVADQDLPPFMWAHSDDVTHYAYDLAKAKSLLAAAGWTPGPDGMMQKAGKRLALEMAFNGTNATRRNAVVQVQALLHAAGIEVDTKPYQGALLFAPKGMGGILNNGKYDLAWTGWVAGLDPDNSSLYTCDHIPPKGNDDTFYCNPDMDAAQRDALAHFDVPSRKKAYDRIEAILTRDVPVLPIWWPRQVQPVNPDLKNFAPNPVTADWNAYTWEI